MYEPKFTYTDRLVSSLIKIEQHKTILQAQDLSYVSKHKIALQAKTYDMFHLAHMLGSEITLKDAEKLASGIKIEALNDERSQMIFNFRNALEFSRSNIADTYAEVDFTILLHIHKLILTSWRETWEARFRNISDVIDNRGDNWLALRDESIPNEQVEKEVAELIEWYRNVSPTLTLIVRLGIFIYRLIEIFPYVAGNKITIIALTDYIMLKHNLSSKAFMSVVKMFDVNDEKLTEGYQLSQKNFDLSIWLEAFTSTIIKELSEVRENIDVFIKDEEKSKKQPFLDLSKRQLKVLRYLQTVPTIKREDYCHMMEVSTMTAFRDLNDLVRKKLLKVEGQGRGTKYRLTSS